MPTIYRQFFLKVLIIFLFFILAINVPVSGQESKSKEFKWNGATYLPGLTYKLYHGQWEKIPDFSTLEVIKSGEVESFKLDIRDCDDNFAIVYYGYIRLPKDGEYTFYLSSDDGSKFFIDNKELIDNDGPHGRLEKSATVTLKKGVYPIKVLFFEIAGEEILEVQCEGPGIEKQDIPAKALFHQKK